MLSARALQHRYRGRSVLAVDALDLEPGSALALVGPNGAGKSTLLRILAFLERPAAGTLLLDGRPVTTAAERRAARRHVTLVEQRPLLFPGTVRDNVRYALGLHGVHGPAAARRTSAALERLGVAPLADRPARALSDGETQRVAVARAVALEPRILLLDEPVAGADRAAAHQFYRVLEEERVRGAALCFASHQLEDAYRWSDRLIALAGGRATPVTPENLFRAELPDGSGARTVRLGPLELEVVTDRAGPVTLAIPPTDIVVSLQPLASSARNQLRGRVTKIAEDGKGGVTLTVDVGVELAARVTPRALQELSISLGSEVVLSIKATAVRVF